jgi:hypothetical protein
MRSEAVVARRGGGARALGGDGFRWSLDEQRRGLDEQWRVFVGVDERGTEGRRDKATELSN